MPSPVLITGGAGFVGSHLVDRLAAAGRRVLVLDDLSTGRRSNLERHLVPGSAAPSAGAGSVELVVGDAGDPATVEALLERVGGVLHLAASVGVRRVVEQPAATLRNNLRGVEVVLAAAAARGLPTLFTSSSEVYCKAEKVPFAEDDDLRLGATTAARWSYAAAKATGEWLALAHASESGLPVVITRLFNTVGPRQVGNYGMVLPRFVAAARAGRPIEVYGDGSQTRCFAHVGEVTQALEALFVRLEQGCPGLSEAGVGDPGPAGRVFNVGSDEEVSMLELAERVRAAADSDSEIRLVPYAEAFSPTSGFEDLPRRVPALAALEAELGFRPRRSLDAIIAELLEVVPVG